MQTSHIWQRRVISHARREHPCQTPVDESLRSAECWVVTLRVPHPIEGLDVSLAGADATSFSMSWVSQLPHRSLNWRESLINTLHHDA